jgi:biotin transport system substrate-specific component
MLAGLLSRKRGIAAVVIGSVLGFAAVLATGSAGLVLLSGADWPKAAAIGVLPFLPGDALKAASAALVAYRLRPFLESLLQRGGSHGR